MKCLYCPQTLACAACQRPYRPATAADFQSLYQPECPVRCPACDEILRCRHCGAVYSGGEEEYGTGDRAE